MELYSRVLTLFMSRFLRSRINCSTLKLKQKQRKHSMTLRNRLSHFKARSERSASKPNAKNFKTYADWWFTTCSTYKSWTLIFLPKNTYLNGYVLKRHVTVGHARKSIFNGPTPLFVVWSFKHQENLGDFVLILINRVFGTKPMVSCVCGGVVGGRSLGLRNEHENLHFDNEYDNRMSSKNYEVNDYSTILI